MKKGFYYHIIAHTIFFYSGKSLQMLCDNGEWQESKVWKAEDFKKTSTFYIYALQHFEHIGA